MSFAYLVSLLLLGSIAFALVREMRKASPRPAGLRGHIRARGWGLLLLPVALMAAVMTGHVHALAVAELAIAGALVTWAPRLAAKLVPYALLALALFGLILAKAYHDGFSNQVQYGLVLAGAGSFRTPLRPAAGRGVLRPRHVAAPAGGGAGRRAGPGADRPLARPAAAAGSPPAQALLLIPVTAAGHAAARARQLVRRAGAHRARRGPHRPGRGRGQRWSWCSGRGSGPPPLAEAGLLVLGAYGLADRGVLARPCPGSSTASPT